MLTKEELAARLNGREYGSEITEAEEAEAAAAGLLVVFGASDDLLEFRGAFSDEIGCYEGATVQVAPTRALPQWDDFDKDDEAEVQQYFADKSVAKPVTATWDAEGYSWVITSDVPHATFEVMEDGEKYCRGLVLAIADLQAA